MPTLLMIGVGLLLVSLGAYQYLSLKAERLERLSQVEPENDGAADTQSD